LSGTLRNKVILLTDTEKDSSQETKQELLRSKYKPYNKAFAGPSCIKVTLQIVTASSDTLKPLTDSLLYFPRKLFGRYHISEGSNLSWSQGLMEPLIAVSVITRSYLFKKKSLPQVYCSN
jgi:hypothetical protein